MTNFPTRSQIDRASALEFDGVKRGDDPAFRDINSAKRDRKRAEAQAAADALNHPQDAPPLVDVPDPPKLRPIIVLSTTVAYRGRIISISNEGMTLDAFCDMLDKKFGVAE